MLEVVTHAPFRPLHVLVVFVFAKCVCLPLTPRQLDQEEDVVDEKFLAEMSCCDMMIATITK